MELRPLTKKTEIATTIARLKSVLSKGGVRYGRTLGFQGGNAENCAVFWLPREKFWFHFGSTLAKNRYWCCYGIENPETLNNLGITVEVNVPIEGIYRQAAGVLLTDGKGKTFLAHSGKIGGGRKGIGKEAFTNFYRGPSRAEVIWPDGQRSSVILVADLSATNVAEQLSSFIYEVARFKKASQRLTTPKMSSGISFSPEFEGVKKHKKRSVVTESVCNHGVVVRHLAQQLLSEKLSIGNNAHCDLFVTGRNGEMKVLFEVKTSCETTDLYTGTGQLMLHGATQVRPPRRVLVVPDDPSPKLRQALKNIGIETMKYAWQNEKPTFPAIMKVLDD